MSKEFLSCVANGGRVRTIKVKGHPEQYMKVCYLNGKSYSGEVHTKKKLSDVSVYRNNDELIDLGDNLFKKQILRVGDWIYGDGKLEVTKDYLKQIAENFKKGVLENVFVPLTHSDDPRDNTGDVKEVEVSKDGKTLEAVLSVDDNAAQLIRDKKVKGVSCSIEENYMDKEKKKNVGSVLRHVALVLEPYIKGLAPFEQLSDKQANYVVLSDFQNPLDSNLKKTLNISKEKKIMKKSEKLLADIEKMKVDNQKLLADKEKELADSKKALEDKDAELKRLADEKALADKAKVEAETIALADKFVTEGKLTPAQKDSFTKILSEFGANEIQLADDNKTSVKELLTDLIEKNAKIALGDEGGTAEGGQPEEIPAETKEALEVTGVSEEDYNKYGKEMNADEISKKLQEQK